MQHRREEDFSAAAQSPESMGKTQSTSHYLGQPTGRQGTVVENLDRIILQISGSGDHNLVKLCFCRRNYTRCQNSKIYSCSCSVEETKKPGRSTDQDFNQEFLAEPKPG